MLIFTGKGMMNQWIRDYPLFRQTVLSMKKILDIMVTGSSRYGPIRSHDHGATDHDRHDHRRDRGGPQGKSLFSLSPSPVMPCWITPVSFRTVTGSVVGCFKWSAWKYGFSYKWIYWLVVSNMFYFS